MARKLSVLLFALVLGTGGTLLHAQTKAEIDGGSESEVMPDSETAPEPEGEPVTVPTWESTRGDVLTVPAAPAEPAPPRMLPRRGMSMADVERQFGPPLRRDPAVGDPPITRWNYDGFSVFFEYRTVLHAVQEGRPEPIYRKDELLPATTP